MTQVTATGFDRTRLDERLADLKAKIQAIFGIDINLDADTLDGQAVGIFAEAISNLDQLSEDVYHSFNPQSAIGIGLSRLVQLNGIRRQAGKFSTVTLRCSGTVGTAIPAQSLAKSQSTGVTFATNVDAVIGAGGYVDVAATATVMGVLTAPINTVTKIETPIYGWQTVTNQAAAILGANEETDEQLRLRRRASTTTPAQSLVESLYGALANIVGVTQVLVLENTLDVDDGNGLPPHSIYCVVQGGAQQTILDTIFLKKSTGATLFGATSGTVTDAMGGVHTVKFGRPAAVPIYIDITLSTRPGWPSDGDVRIKNAIVAWALINQLIGQPVIHSRLFDPINSVPGHSVSLLEIGTAPAPTGVVDISIPFDQLATFDVANISVTIV